MIKILLCSCLFLASDVYILLKSRSDEDEELKDTMDEILEKVEINAITFAVPLFGDVTLWSSLDGIEKYAQLYHFVIDADIVPALLFEEKVYEKLSTTIENVTEAIKGRNIVRRLLRQTILSGVKSVKLDKGQKERWNEIKTEMEKKLDSFRKMKPESPDSNPEDRYSYYPIGKKYTNFKFKNISHLSK